MSFIDYFGTLISTFFIIISNRTDIVHDLDFQLGNVPRVWENPSLSTDLVLNCAISSKELSIMNTRFLAENTNYQKDHTCRCHQ